jgi:MFS family permease
MREGRYAVTGVISLMAVIQAMCFSALAPLLPTFEAQNGLTKTQAGLLVGVFPLGLALVAIPVGLLTSRVGPRRFAVTGLVMLGVGSAGFGLAEAYGWLLATRMLQGVGSALCWSSGLAWIVWRTSRSGRAAAIGLFTGAGAAGQVIGPVIGALAILCGRAPVFAAVAVVTVALAVAASRIPGPSVTERSSVMSVKRAHAALGTLAGLWLVMVPGVLMGTLFALAPLQLSRLGYGTVAISAIFIITAAVGVAARPLAGRWADRGGLRRSLKVFIFVAIIVTLTLPSADNRWVFACCVVLALNAYGVLLGPAMAVASHAYESSKIAQVLAFALIGIATGTGFFLGSSVGGALAANWGDAVAYTLCAVICLLTVFGLSVAKQTIVSRDDMRHGA